MQQSLGPAISHCPAAVTPSHREARTAHNSHTYKDEEIEEDHHGLKEAETLHGGSWEADKWELGISAAHFCYYLGRPLHWEPAIPDSSIQDL